MTSIYVASSFPRKDEARILATELEALGFEVTSRWLEHEGPDAMDNPEAGEAAADMDIEDVIDADILVCITGDALTRGGRHTEIGIAIGCNMHVYLLGPRENVFHWFRKVHVHSCKEDLFKQLKEYHG